MVFNVPKHTLIYCAMGGAITYITRTICLHAGFGIEISLFSSNIYWNNCSLLVKKISIPRPVYTVASIIPMIPGTYAFSAMISLVDMNSHGVTEQLIELFVFNGLKAVSILGAISFGLALPSLYFMRLNRPVI